MLDIVRIAAERIGGVPRLAQRIGVTRQAIYQWREVPADRVGEIAAATGIARARLRPDLFGLSADEQAWHLDAIEDAAPAIDFTDLRRDRLAWTEAQAGAVATQTLSGIDTDRLVDLLRSLADDARADIERRMQVIVVRLLKWQYRPVRRSLSTIAVINAERARVLSRLSVSASLRGHAEAALSRIYASAIGQVADETGLARDVFPVDCPFGLADLLDPTFAPVTNVA
jgi:DNA-binding transcriptional regulator YdaS (Cro superfamily)